jgi:hypothetical protein
VAYAIPLIQDSRSCDRLAPARRSPTFCIYSKVEALLTESLATGDPELG